ncbi:MAG: lipid-binding SYLF domain-containing protein [Gammaproteobacteria bacterium]|nr:lipid-binding SYLF domain-containing protein [Gammaproteobacteria bacterium]
MLLAACAGWQPGASQADTMTPQVNAAVVKFKAKDPSLERFFRDAYGYAVFPSVGKGGFWIGGAYGNGEVYEQGRLVGVTSIALVTVGPQIGGQAYSEIIFFRDKQALDTFKAGNYTFNAQVSAVAATAGAAANADYSNGVAVFTLVEGGLMAEATVGGQKFSFTPLK